MKNPKIIIAIISLWLFVGTIAVVISMHGIDKQTENTTTSYTATVSGVEITNTGEGKFAEIDVKEYRNHLAITTNISKHINIDDVQNLKNGQIIYFQIENVKVQHLNNSAFVDITSLKTDEKVIFSLDEYNQYMRISAYPARIAGIVFSLLFLSISVFCFYKIKRNRTRNSD